jgi:hypothetical protein
MKIILIVAGLMAASASAGIAGPIEKACLQSDRGAANRAVCGCIQQVADLTLRGADQRKAAKFFTDPHKAQVVRQSASKSDNEFWMRYKNFGETAEAYCAG